jgi:hypothetical protein
MKYLKQRFRGRALSLTLAAVLALGAALAFAQQQSIIYGTEQPSKVTRAVQVDNQGRLVIAGGSGGGSVYFSCGTRVQSVTSVGNVASALPVGVATRWMVRVCNSAENAGAPLVKCRDDGVNPSMGVANPGEVLEVGDCVTYYTSAAIRCISDGTATAVTQAECAL